MSTNMKSLNGYGFDAQALGGKAPSAYTQNVDGVPPDSAGNVPLNIVSGSRYYNDYTAGGTGDVDYITDTFAMVPIGTDKNPDLFAALGSVGSYAYVKTSFYNTQTSTSRRYQVAYSYNAIVQRKAFRTYTSSGWLGWQTDAQSSDVPRFNLLDNSNFANPVVQAGLNGKHGNTAYLCDRWSSYGVTGEQKNGYIKLTGSIASSRITQNLDGVAGKTITAAAKVTGSGRVYVGVYYTVDGTSSSITKAVNAPNGIISARGTIPSNAESVGFRIYPDNNGENLSANVFWAALYEGEYTDDNLPPYAPKGYAAELAECMRYFERIGSTNSEQIGNVVYVVSGAKSFICSLQCSRKRIQHPTVSFNGVDNYRLLLKDSTNANTYSASPISSFDSITVQEPFISFRVNMPGTINQNSWIALQRSDNATAAYIDVSADL